MYHLSSLLLVAIGKGQLCTQGGGGGGLSSEMSVGKGGLNRDATLDQNLYFIFIRSRGSLENHTRFQTIMVKIISVF